MTPFERLMFTWCLALVMILLASALAMPFSRIFLLAGITMVFQGAALSAYQAWKESGRKSRNNV